MQVLYKAPVLSHISALKMFIVSADASKYIVGANLEQQRHPVAYLCYRLSDIETKWDRRYEELLNFMITLREWDVYLRGRPFNFKLDTKVCNIYSPSHD